MVFYQESNQQLWDELTPIHERSSYYALENFKRGKLSLMPLEMEEIGDVMGKSLLHLQCHLGLDTLSWVRLGAEVTGVDFSEKSIAVANSLSDELKLRARFIHANIYEMSEVLTDEYDIVFTSYGVLSWLPDLNRWAQTIYRHMKEGGLFYIVDFHPFTGVFANESNTTDWQIADSYFHKVEPAMYKPGHSYADENSRVQSPSYEWQHPLSNVINALIQAGLTIKWLHEFPFCQYRHFSFLQKDKDGWWRINSLDSPVPLMFSVAATK
jgi:SAM-dependent methyltransferase